MHKRYFSVLIFSLFISFQAFATNKNVITLAVTSGNYLWNYAWSAGSSCTVGIAITKTDCCVNGTNGTATAFGSGGTGSYTYQWSPGGATTQTISGLTPGGYTVTVTDSMGCSSTASVTLNILPYIISTVTGIGDGLAGYTGDGGAASAAEINYPWKIVFDHNDNLYITDRDNNVIRKINTNGIISTVAGNGFQPGGFSGDGQQATTAELYNPVGVYVDNGGNIYIADQVNERVRKVDPTGIITTIAGNGNPGYGGEGGNADTSSLVQPADIVTDAAGNIYIADAGNDEIRKINTNGIISDFAGKPDRPGFTGDGGQATAAELSDPSGLAIDAFGNIYIADYLNNAVRKVNTNGIISTIAGLGPTFGGYNGDNIQATAAKLFHPFNIALDNAGNIYIADGSNVRIRMVNTSGIITTVAGNGIAWGPGHGIAAFGDGGFATKAQIGNPDGVAVDAAQNIYFADAIGQRIREMHACPYCGIRVADTLIQNPTCNGNNGSAFAVAFNGVPQFTYSWAPTGGNTSTATGLSAGTYTATVTDSIGCTVASPITLTSSSVTANITGPDSVCQGDVVTLTASGGTSYTWSDGSTNASVTATLNRDSTFTVTASVGPCNGNATHIVYVGTDESLCAIHFYDGITPNGDGFNDYWQIDNIQLNLNNRVEIYNRWGTLVWSATGYDNNKVVWRGQDNQNKPLVDGTYYYLVQINGRSYKGWVQLTR